MLFVCKLKSYLVLFIRRFNNSILIPYVCFFFNFTNNNLFRNEAEIHHLNLVRIRLNAKKRKMFKYVNPKKKKYNFHSQRW